MIEENALVLGIDNNTATLEIVRSAPCGICGQTRGCGISLWGKIFRHKSSIFKAINNINVRIGDIVVVGIEEKAVLFSSMMVYGLPLITMLIGVLIANALSPASSGDLYAVLGALSGLAVGYAWLKGHAQTKRFDSRYQPVILRLGDRSVINMKCERGE